MIILQTICQIIIGLGILNVWLLRSNKHTAYRGRDAKSLKEEFAAYGLSPAALWIVGVIKIAAAIALLVGIWIPALVLPAAGVVAVLMAGAIAMHAKVKDPVVRHLPATAMFLLSSAVIVLALT